MVKLIIANWKMHQDKASVKSFVENLTTFDQQINLVICPSFLHIDYISSSIDNKSTFLGSQNVNHHNEHSGPFTGEISAEMLSNIGCKYCIVGHSERRTLFSESADQIKQKISFLKNYNIKSILCVGEEQLHREKKQEFEHIKEQILKSIPKDTKQDDIIIAYEPIWSIGSGIIPTISQIKEMIDFIKEICIKEIEREFKIVYGGSVNENNAGDILSIKGISGLLIGSASLNIKSINQIIKLAYQS